jgi:hypothetical protein
LRDFGDRLSLFLSFKHFGDIVVLAVEIALPDDQIQDHSTRIDLLNDITVVQQKLAADQSPGLAYELIKQQRNANDQSVNRRETKCFRFGLGIAIR